MYVATKAAQNTIFLEYLKGKMCYKVSPLYPPNNTLSERVVVVSVIFTFHQRRSDIRLGPVQANLQKGLLHVFP